MVDKGLVKETKKAFAGARLGDGIGLGEAKAIDDYARKDEITRRKEQHKRQDLQDIRPKFK